LLPLRLLGVGEQRLAPAIDAADEADQTVEVGPAP
jgi:hypothetical protein